LQASAEQFEDQLKGLLDRTEQTDAGQHQGGGGGGSGEERPARKRRKLLDVEEYKQAYDEVMVVDEGENEPEEEMAGADEEEQYEDIDPKDISRCSICSDEFPSARELKEHQKEADHGYSLACKVCDKKFKKIHAEVSRESCAQRQYAFQVFKVR